MSVYDPTDEAMEETECRWCGTTGLLIRRQGFAYHLTCPQGCGYRVTYGIKEYEEMIEPVDNFSN